MGLYSSEHAALASPFPGVEVFDVGGGLDVDEFTMIVESMRIPTHYDANGLVVQERPAQQIEAPASMIRSPNNPREPWAPDHHPHADMTYWGTSNAFATVLYAKRLEGDVAGTAIFDTALLAQAIEADHPGIIEELMGTTVTFSVARYYLEVLAKKATDESIKRTIADKGKTSLQEVADSEGLRYPPKTFPTMPKHPFRHEMPSIMIDGVRTVSINGLTPARSEEIIGLVQDEYLHPPHEALEGRSYYHVHAWEEGDVLVFTQIGTLHQARPSPAGEQVRETKRLFIA